MEAVTIPSTWNTRLSPPPLTVTPPAGPVIAVAPVVSVSSSWLPARVIVCGVLNTPLAKVIVSAPAVEFAWPTPQRRLPTLPSSRSLWTVKVDGTVRSSSSSRAGRARGGALRIGRVTGRANRLRTQERIDMGASGKRMEQGRRPPAPRADGVKGEGSSRSRGADRRRDLTETLGGHHEGALQQLLVVVDQVGEAPRQHRHGEDLLDAARELEQGDNLAAAQVHDADAARPLLRRQPLGDGDAAENGRLADLRQPDEGQLAREVQPAREPRHGGDRLVPPGAQVHGAQR